MYCDNCGEVLELGQAICSKCGTPVVGAPSKKDKHEHVEVSEEIKEEKKEVKTVKKRRLKKTPIICFIIILIGFFAIIILWDKVMNVDDKKTTTTTKEVTTGTKEEDKKDLIKTKEILLSNQIDKIVINYYNAINDGNNIITRDILFNENIIMEDGFVSGNVGAYNEETAFDNDLSNYKTYNLLDQNGVDNNTVLLVKTNLENDFYDHKLLVINSTGNKVYDKTVVLYSRRPYLEASTREELGDRSIKEILPLYQAYNNDEYDSAPIDIVNNELRVLLISDEANIKAKEYKILINNGEVSEEEINVFASDSPIIRTSGERIKEIE